MKIVHCADPQTETRIRFAKTFGVAHNSPEMEAVLNDPQVDAIYIATPHFLHYPQVLAAIQAGKPALCEKPLALNLEEGMTLAAQVQKAGIKVGVNHQFRYDSGCFALRQAVVDGELGSISRWDCRTRFGRDPDYFLKGKWRGLRAQSGGGTLFTHGSHALDIALWAHSSHPSAIPLSVKAQTRRIRYPHIEVEDDADAKIEMSDGSRITLNSTLLKKSWDPLQLDAWGEKGSGHYQGFLRSRLRFQGVSISRQSPPTSGLHAFFRSMEGFRRWITDGQPYLAPLESSLPLLAVLNAAYASADSGRSENVDTRWRN
jgi:predicted dehydrogenase